jgi:hypothetical protein
MYSITYAVNFINQVKKEKVMKKEFKSYMINCDVIGQMHSYMTGKTQAEATAKALASSLAEGHADAVVVGVNVEFNAGVCL